MDRNLQRTISQLHEFSGIINAFESEAVQAKVTGYILHSLAIINNRPGHDEMLAGEILPSNSADGLLPRKSGAKNILDYLLAASFFNEERSIGAIIEQFKVMGYVFLASQISGTLLALVRSGRLKRYHSPVKNRYVFIKNRYTSDTPLYGR
jgi:hypothetical protein